MNFYRVIREVETTLACYAFPSFIEEMQTPLSRAKEAAQMALDLNQHAATREEWREQAKARCLEIAHRIAVVYR